VTKPGSVVTPTAVVEGGGGVIIGPGKQSDAWPTFHRNPSGTPTRIVQRPSSWYAFGNSLGDTFDWYTFIEKPNLNSNVKSQSYNKNEQGAYVDDEGRYWVAVGPGVTGTYTQGMSLSSAALLDSMYGDDRMGRKIDVLVENIHTGERFFIYCIIGETKEHTGTGTIVNKNGETLQVNGEGIYQTNVSVVTGKTDPSNSIDASIIEFLSPSITSELKNYRLISILVY